MKILQKLEKNIIFFKITLFGKIVKQNVYKVIVIVIN